MVNVGIYLNEIHETTEIRISTRLEKLVRWIPLAPHTVMVRDRPCLAEHVIVRIVSMA